MPVSRKFVLWAMHAFNVLTLSRREVVGVVEIEAIEAPAARLPPPAALQHRGAIQARAVVVAENNFAYVTRQINIHSPARIRSLNTSRK